MAAIEFSGLSGRLSVRLSESASTVLIGQPNQELAELSFEQVGLLAESLLHWRIARLRVEEKARPSQP